MYSSFYRVFFKFHFITLCFVVVVYSGAPVPRMRGALARYDIWYYGVIFG